MLSAENDATQSKKDIPHYEKLFGRPVKAVNMGNMGHTALLFDPVKYVTMLEKSLVKEIIMICRLILLVLLNFLEFH